MNKILSIFLFLWMGCAVSQAQPEVTQNQYYNDVEISSLSPLSVSGKQGVSAPFAGRCGETILVAGGCNFPGVPAAEGGPKVYYDQIYAYPSHLQTAGEWKEVGRLPEAAAYGASVTVDKGIVLLGGTNGDKSFANVSLMQYANGKLSFQALPSLPVALDNFGAAFGGGYIYAVGGQSNGNSNFKAFRLAYPGGKAWEVLPDMPGAVRMQPAVAVQNNAVGPCLYVMGGYAPASGQTTGVVHKDGLRYDPKTNTWAQVAFISPHGEMRTLTGASAVAVGCAHILYFGGVNYNIFEDAINRPADRRRALIQGDTAKVAAIDRLSASYMEQPAEWYKFNKEILVYHTITDTWTTASSNSLLARAGAGLVDFDNCWVLINGESKPGVRASDVTCVEMETDTEFGWLNWVVLVVYLVGMLALGFYFMRRENGTEDFFKGGGRVPWWAAGISIYATMLSAITYMAYPAKAYATDWTYYPMLVTILLVSFPVMHYYLPFFRKLNVTSAYEYLESRFNAATRLMASALFITFMVARMALVLYLPSLALTAVTGIDIYLCILLMGIITTVYCTMGGVEAVIWGDVVQGFILVGGAIFAFIYLALNTEGGWGGFIDIALADDKMRLFDWSFDYRSATFWVIILGGMANNFISYTSDQTIIQRYMTTKDENASRRSILLNGVMSVFVSVAFFAIGTGLYTFFKTHPADLNFTMEKPDAIFPFFMMSKLPAGIAGLLIAAIFAATMSTISSNINSVATAFTVDFYNRWNPGKSDAHKVNVARYACLVSGVIGIAVALLMATWNILSFLDFFQEILGLLSSGLGGLFLMGIFFPRIGGKSAMIGFCSGVLSVFLIKNFTEISFLIYGAIGLVVSVGVAYLVSLFIQERCTIKGLTWESFKRIEEK